MPTAGITNNTGSTELNCTYGSIGFTATGGSSYSWSNGSNVVGNNPLLTVTSPGTYIVTVTGSNGCSASSSIVITQALSVPVITTQPSRTAQKLTLNLIPPAYTVVVGGSGSFNYQWYRNTIPSNAGGSAVPGAVSSSFVPSTAAVSTYFYYVIITNNSGCAVTSELSGYITVCGQ